MREVYIYIVKEKNDSQREKAFLKYTVMPSLVICTKIFLQFFLYSTVNKKE